MDAIEKLSSYLGDREKDQPGQQTRLAAHLRVSQGLVWQWLNRRTPIAPVHARGIEEYTNAAVTRYDIAPKVFGPPPREGLRPTTSQVLKHLETLLTPVEFATVASAMERGAHEAIVAIDALDVPVSIRSRLLEAARAAGAQQ